LLGLVDCYYAAMSSARSLGARDLAQVATRHLREVTSHLDGPEWDGLALWARANIIGASARDRAHAVAMKAANDLSSELDRPEVAELYGMLHLTAALSCTVTGKLDQAADHIREADEIARRPGVVDVNFCLMQFGVGNVAIWRTTLAVEAGEGGRAMEIAQAIDPATLPPSPSRRAGLYIDLGRALTMERQDDEAVQAFRAARQLAPQRAHADPWIREVVTTMYERARREAIKQDLRGLAYWLGIGREN
jgi:hypothetical protein